MTLDKSQSTNDLVDRLKKGDTSAFEDLYDLYSPSLFGIVSRIVKSENEAKDVIQESFVKIWKNIHSFNPTKGSFFTWILNITRNTAIDKLRKIKKMSTRTVQLDNSGVDIKKDGDNATKIDHIGIKEFVDKLQPKHKILIEYIYFKGYTQSEVSKELDIPIGTVKSRIRTALIELRKVFMQFIFWI